jgi:hypothetical protein
MTLNRSSWWATGPTASADSPNPQRSWVTTRCSPESAETWSFHIRRSAMSPCKRTTAGPDPPSSHAISIGSEPSSAVIAIGPVYDEYVSDARRRSWRAFTASKLRAGYGLAGTL